MIIAKYYVKTKKGFAIRKTMNGKRKEYAVCEDEQTAKKLVKELKKVGWDEEQLDCAVYNMLNKREPKYYSENRGRYEVRKIINGKQTNYGVYEDEEMAKAIVEELKLVDEWRENEKEVLHKN